MGSFRSQPDLVKHSEEKEGLGLTYAYSHMCGWRNYMEDAHISISPLSDKKVSLFGIFDGHGGAEVSAFTERHFVIELENNKNYKKGNYELALKETFLRIDELLLSEEGKKQIVRIQKEMKEKNNGPTYEEESHAGCTANVVLITSDFIYCANAGDSRAVSCIKGEHKELSTDHKPEDKIQIDRIKKAGGEISYGRVNGNLNLTRALGDLEYKRNAQLSPEEQMITANPDILKIKNQNVDFIVMGCDGIWEVKSNADMVKWVKKRLDEKKDMIKTLEQLLDELVAKDSASTEYGMDNMSVILIRIDKNKK